MMENPWEKQREHDGTSQGKSWGNHAKMMENPRKGKKDWKLT